MLTGTALMNELVDELNELKLSTMAATLDDLYHRPGFLEMDRLTLIAELIGPQFQEKVSTTLKNRLTAAHLKGSPEALADCVDSDKREYLPAGITDALMVGALVIFGKVFGVNSTDISTASTLLLAIVGLMILYRICKPLNLLRTAVLIGCAAGMLICIFFVSDLFAITSISVKCAMLLAIFAIATEPVMRYGSMIIEFISSFCSKIYHKVKKEA